MTSSKYPFGSKSEATAICRCGQVEITLSTQNPVLAGFCHCEDCRRAHAAPIYHYVYGASANICAKTGQSKKGSFELMIRRGLEQLIDAKRDPGESMFSSFNNNPIVGGIGRLFCKDCGVMMLNAFFMKANTEINPTSKEIEMYGLFTGTFTEKMNSFIESWQPQFHIWCSQATLPISIFDDGIDKWETWPGGKKWTG